MCIRDRLQPGLLTLPAERRHEFVLRGQLPAVQAPKRRVAVQTPDHRAERLFQKFGQMRAAGNVERKIDPEIVLPDICLLYTSDCR